LKRIDAINHDIRRSRERLGTRGQFLTIHEARLRSFAPHAVTLQSLGSQAVWLAPKFGSDRKHDVDEHFFALATLSPRWTEIIQRSARFGGKLHNRGESAEVQKVVQAIGSVVSRSPLPYRAGLVVQIGTMYGGMTEADLQSDPLELKNELQTTQADFARRVIELDLPSIKQLA
jgi:hypothetical protein